MIPFMFWQLMAVSTAVVVAAKVPLARSPPSARSGTGYSSIVVFGDSFSDNGSGAYRISNGTWPLVPPYYQGRFSNGPVWAEYLASNLSLPLYDYAAGGATTSNALVQGFTGPASTIPVPSVADQVASFLSGALPWEGSSSSSSPQGTNTSTTTTTDADFSTPLFVLWAGANDVFFDANISAAQSYLEIRAAAAALLQAARPAARVLLVASPDLSRLPYGFYADPLAKSQLRSFTDLLASLLLAAAAGGRRGGSASPAVGGDGAVAAVDLRGLFDDFEYFAEPQAYGFEPLGKYGSCLVGVYGEGADGMMEECDDVEGRVYWDEYHPTTRTHSWIAQEILDALS